MKRSIIKTAFVISLLFSCVSAGSQVLPYTAADVSPVTLAKGSAGLVETGSTAYSAFGNVAAVPFSETTLDVAAGYAMWQPASVSSNLINVAGAYNLNGKLGVALGFSYGANPAYTVTDETGATVGTFNPSDMQINAGVSYRLIPALAVGANVGYASSSLAEGHSYGAVMADVFLMSQFSDFKVAAGVSNLGSKVKSASGAEFGLPASLALGAGYDKAFAQKHAVEVNVDADYFFTGGVAVAAGASYTFDSLVSVRAGYRYGGNTPFASFASVGAGLQLKGVKLDIAYLLGSEVMKNTLAIGLGYSF